ncbi:MAG: hypothetical protein EKK64_04340 [Neisseriaceae bacterium]|nr:MAG: hypothetical protein EKK64_04340 [Neisseriaceae bacterium]
MRKRLVIIQKLAKYDEEIVLFWAIGYFKTKGSRRQSFVHLDGGLTQSKALLKRDQMIDKNKDYYK